VIAYADSPNVMDGESFVVADVGGTHARLALAQASGSGTPALRFVRRYRCADHSSLAEIIRQFLQVAADRRVVHAAIAIAGVVQDDMIVSSNLPWAVSLAQLRQTLPLKSIELINDFAAVAYATPHIDLSAPSLICGPAPTTLGTTIVVGPGTGFGAALWVPSSASEKSARVLATEVGHAAWAPGDTTELEILRRLWRVKLHVNNEHVLSGPGLVNVYRGVCEIGGHAPHWTNPADIASAASRADDAQAATALRIFCNALGSLCGDLAISFRADAVLLAGGIPSQIRNFLLTSDFVARYRNKGALRGVVERVPVLLVEHGQLGLTGAAAWHLDHRCHAPTSVAA